MSQARDVPDIRIEREVMIHAHPATIFRYFSDPERFGAWFGAGSSMETRPGGEIDVHYPDGRKAVGEVLEVAENERIVFTWGWIDHPVLPPGSSTVEVQLVPDAHGTLVRLTHSGLPSDEIAIHARGWEHYVPRLGEVAAGLDPGPDRGPPPT